MKNIYFITLALACSLLVQGQTFTISQLSTGSTQNVFGQGFTPSIQGNGSGSVGTARLVGLYEFSFMLDATKTPDVLYIYEVLPSSKEALLDGTGGTVVGTSISKTSESYWFTSYQFKGLALDKDKIYYALFREAVICEIAGGNYTGGDIYRLGNDGTLNTTVYVDAKFTASFAPPSSTPLATLHTSLIMVRPNLTSGAITISSQVPAVIEVYASTGVKVKTFNVGSGQTTESIDDLPNGIYMFLSDNNEVCNLVKQ